MAVNKKLPASRLMIQYDTRVEGIPKKKELPFRLLALGDFSKGRSKDAKIAFEDREVRHIKNGIDAELKDMNITLDLNVANSINPKSSSTLDIAYKLEKLADFRPDRIIKKVPQLSALIELRKMLSSFEKDVDNNRALRKVVDKVFSDKDRLEELKKDFNGLDKYLLQSKTANESDENTSQK